MDYSDSGAMSLEMKDVNNRTSQEYSQNSRRSPNTMVRAESNPTSSRERVDSCSTSEEETDNILNRDSRTQPHERKPLLHKNSDCTIRRSNSNDSERNSEMETHRTVKANPYSENTRRSPEFPQSRNDWPLRENRMNPASRHKRFVYRRSSDEETDDRFKGDKRKLSHERKTRKRNGGTVRHSNSFTSETDTYSPDDSLLENDLLLSFEKGLDENEILAILYRIRKPGFDINRVTDSEGNTLLHMAVKANSKLLVVEILDTGIEIEAKNRDDKTALEVALHAGNSQFDEVAAVIVNEMENSQVRKTFEPEIGFKFQWLVECGFDKTADEVLNCMIDKQDGNSGEVFFDVLEADTDGRSPQHPDYRQNSFSIYQWMALEDKIDLINHDIVRRLTTRKWESFGRVTFGFQILFYLLSVFCLTFVAVTSVTSNDVGLYDDPLQQARAVFELISVFCVCGQLLAEVAQVCRTRQKYFQDLFNILEISACIVLILAVPLRFFAVEVHWYFFAVGYGIWLSIIFKYAVVFRCTGVHAEILWEILKKDVLQFSLLFIVVNLAFAGCFLLMLKADKDLLQQDDTSSFFRIVYIGLRTLVEGGPVVAYTGEDAFGAMSTIVLLLFLFLTVVILLNILIAQVNNTYQSIHDDADRQYELRLATVIAWIEINGNICPCFKKIWSNNYKSSEFIPKLYEVFNVAETTGEESLRKTSEIIVRKQATNEANMLTLLSSMRDLQEMNKVTVNKNLAILHHDNTTISSRLEDLSNRVTDSLCIHRDAYEWLFRMIMTADDFGKTLEEMSRDITKKSGETTKLQHSTDADMSERLNNTFHKQTRITEVIRTNDQDVINDSSFMKTVVERRELERNIDVPDSALQLEFERTDVFFDQISTLDEPEVLGLLSGDNTNRQYDMLSPNGETALHIAATRGFYFVVEFLIDRRADMNIPARTGKKLVIERALERNNDEVAALIATKMGKPWVRELFQRRDLNQPPVLNLLEYLDGDCPNFLNVVLDSMVDEQDVHFNILECDHQGYEPNCSEFDDSKETVFHKIARLGNKNTISHKAVRILIDRKWQNFARGRFFFQMVMYLLSLFSLTMAAVLGIEADDVIKYPEHIDGVRTIFEVFIYAYTIFITMPNEIIEMKRKGLDYARSFDLLEGVSAVLIIAVLPVRYINVQAHWYIFAIAYLLWAMGIFKYAAVFREYGAYAQVLWLIIKSDVIQFSVLFAVVNLAFSGTYFLALKADNNINMNNETSTFQGIVYAGLQTITKGGPVLSYADGYGFFSVAIQMAFLFVTLVILLNILIAQLSNTYTNIQGDAQRELETRMAKIIVSVERGVWACSRQTDVKNFYAPRVSLKDNSKVQNKSLLSQIDKKLQYISDKQVNNQMKLVSIKSETKRCSEEFSNMKETIDTCKLATENVQHKIGSVNTDIGAMSKTVWEVSDHVIKLQDLVLGLHEKLDQIHVTLLENLQQPPNSS